MLFAHADDTTCVFINIDSIGEVLRLYQEYSKMSGAKLNRNKCAIMPMKGHTQDDFRLYVLNGINVVDTVKVRGVYLGQNARIKNQEMVKTKIDKTLKQYEGQKLTLFTRSTVINTVILAQLYGIRSSDRSSHKRLHRRHQHKNLQVSLEKF